MDAVSRECMVTVEALSRWREDVISGGIAGLKGKTLDDVRVAALEKKVGKQAMLLELNEKQNQFLKTRSEAPPASVDR